MPDPIEIKIAVATAEAVESMHAFVESTREDMAKAYTGAVDTAQRKLDELNRKQIEHREIIERNGQLIQQLSAQQQTASQGEIQNIDQRIEKLKQLNATHQQQLAILEQQKIKAEERGMIALGGTEAEIAALKKANTQQLVNIGAMQDQVKAYAAVKDAATAQIASAVAGIHEVVNQQKIHQQAIELDKVKLTELMEKRAEASGAEAKQLDQQIASLKKSMANQEQELRNLDTKRVKLEELLALTTATSEAEIKAAQEMSQASQAEIQSLNDVTRAQNSVTTAVDGSTFSMSNLMQQFGGLVGVTSVIAGVTAAFRVLTEVEQAAIDKAHDANAALKDLSHQQMSAQDKLDSGFNEYGANDSDTKRKIQGVLFGDASHDSVPVQYGSNEDQTRTAFAAIAPVLKQHGISPDDPRFAQLVGTASLFSKKGVDDTLIRNVTTDVLKDNNAAGGDDLNSKLSTMVDVAGSPKYASALGDAIYSHRRQAELGGLNDQDIMKMYQSGRDKGLSPEETGEAVSGLETSARRFVGKTYQEKVQLFEQLSGVLLSEKNKRTIEQYKKHAPNQVLDEEMKLTGEVSPTIRKWLNGSATTRDVLADMSSMPQGDLDLIASKIGGGRLTSNATILPGWTNQQLPTGSFTNPLITPEQHTQALVDQGNNRAALDQPISPVGEAFGETMPNTVKYMSQHRDLYPTGMDPQGFGQNYVPGMNTLMGNGERQLTPEMIQRSYAIGMEYLSAAKMLDDPRIPSAEKATIRAKMQSLLPYMGVKDHNVPQGFETLMGNDSGARAKLLQGLGTRDDQMQYLQKNIGANSPNLPANILDDKSIDGALGGIDSLRTKYIDRTAGPPRPTTGPSAINYHIRNVQYGYTNDATSGGAPLNNNYG